MSKLIALVPNGPNGLESCQVVPAESLLTAAPAEQGTVIFSEEKQTCGIWEATPYAERMDDYPFNEMAHILSGKVIITPDGEQPQSFGAGDTYVMRKGFNGRFEVTETCRKYYFTVE
ncbi:cupin domain-containing protein [Rhizobium helianthi]|uniref:Cupin domain-containing protein n=1 Tax=Rhizobium helianthi TaxID=1132695 RepID=A0ABW4M0R3_9HYPH